MKKLTALSIFAAAIMLMAFNQQPAGNAVAQRITGLDVYVYSEPTRPYEIIENGKVMMTLTGGCSEVVNQAVKKASKADAQGVIVYLESSKWIAIKYK